MRRTVTIVVLGLLAACSATHRADLQVRVEYVETVDFSTWRTYRFATEPQDPGEEQSHFKGLEHEAQSAIEANLADRGYLRIEDGVPDFRIAVDVASRGESGSSLGRPTSSDPGLPPLVMPSKTNTLTVLMLHPSTSQVLWQGRVTGFKLDAIQLRGEIEAAVWRLFVEFPPITR